MKFLRGLLGALCALSLLPIFLWFAATIPSGSMNFYSREYDKYSIPQSIGVEKDDLMNVTKVLTDYMLGHRGDMVVNAVVNGETREFFDQREKDHMADVRGLFDGGRNIVHGAIAVFAVSALLLLLLSGKWKLWLRVLAKAFVITDAAFLAVVAVIAGVFVSNFDWAFTQFHLMFFSNSLWILDPSVDLLVDIVPEPFFVDISIYGGALFAGQIVILIALSAVALKTFLRKKRIGMI